MPLHSKGYMALSAILKTSYENNKNVNKKYQKVFEKNCRFCSNRQNWTKIAAKCVRINIDLLLIVVGEISIMKNCKNTKKI